MTDTRLFDSAARDLIVTAAAHLSLDSEFALNEVPDAMVCEDPECLTCERTRALRDIAEGDYR